MLEVEVLWNCWIVIFGGILWFVHTLGLIESVSVLDIDFSYIQSVACLSFACVGIRHTHTHTYIYIYIYGVRPVCRLHLNQKCHFAQFYSEKCPQKCSWKRVENCACLGGIFLYLFPFVNKNNTTKNNNDQTSLRAMSKRLQTWEMFLKTKIEK